MLQVEILHNQNQMVNFGDEFRFLVGFMITYHFYLKFKKISRKEEEKDMKYGTHLTMVGT